MKVYLKKSSRFLSINLFKMSENVKEMRSLALTPTWSVATVLTIFVFVSLLVERLIHRLSSVSNVQHLSGALLIALSVLLYLFLL